MSLRLASFAALAALATLVASGACTGSIDVVDATSAAGTEAATSTGAGGGTGSGSSSAASSTGGPCTDTCSSEGATRCIANSSQTCMQTGSCLVWSESVHCPNGKGCNNEATKCITGYAICEDTSQCFCGEECSTDMCVTTTPIPTTKCMVDADCGPECKGLHCVAQKCEPVTCVDSCMYLGTTRCQDSAIVTCALVGACFAWTAPVACPAGQTCDGHGFKCSTSPDICDSSNECVCGETCEANTCVSTGDVPQACIYDSDCDWWCAWSTCVDNKCVMPK